jgi:inner membrane protein YhjD
MNKVKQFLRAVDRIQQSRHLLAVPVATWKKFADDQAGNLAALIAYYAFASIFPLLLVFVTILDLVLRNNPAEQTKLKDSALSQYPVVGKDLLDHVHGLHQTGLALVIGLVLTLLAATGVAGAAQNALNSVWEVPLMRRPGFPWSQVRSLGLILVIGPGILATIVLSSLAGGTGHVLNGVVAHILTVAVSLLLNVGLFWLGFRIATAKEVATRNLRLSAILAAVVWQILQVVGGYFVAHAVHSNSAYGVFGVVLGLLAWFYLQAQITLYVVELNVVRVHRLWPRSLNPPLTDADRRSYELYANSQQRQKEIEVVTRPAGRTEPPDRTEQDPHPVPEPRAGHGQPTNGQPTNGQSGNGQSGNGPGQSQGKGPGQHRQRRSSLRQYATRATQRLRRG